MRLLTSMASRDLLADLIATADLPVEMHAAGGVVVAQQVRDGEQADLVVLAAGAIARLAADDFVGADPVPLFTSETVLAVAAQAPTPDIGTIDALQQTLLAATGIGYSTGPSGDGFLALLDDWGLRQALADRLVQARAGVGVGSLIADGEVSIGIQQRPELARATGVRILGGLPDDAAITTTFTAGVLTASSAPEQTRAVLAALTAPGTADIVRRHGMEPAHR